ncbi:MAG: AAA family ATPase [Methylophilus sp.]
MTQTSTSSSNSVIKINQDKKRELNAVRLWILRILVELDGNSKFLNKYGFDSNEIAKFLGLDEFIYGDFDQLKVRERILQLYKLKNKPGTGLPVNSTLSKNVTKLAKILNLVTTEKSILHFSILIKSNYLLSDAIDLLGQSRTNVISRLFAGCLNLETSEVTKSFKPESMLSKTGLLVVDPTACYSIDSKITLINGLAELVDSQDANLIDMFRSSFSIASAAKLTNDDYPHLRDDIELLQQYINFVHKNKKVGANILIYGAPGVGKTEFAKMIATLTKSSLYEIGFEDDNLRPLKGIQRFRAYKAAQTLFSKNKNHMILFDEVEDVFVQPSDSLEKYGNNSGNKAWVNKVLEENPVPAFWLTNNLSGIDKAFIRRFDFVIEMTSPPKGVREKLLNSYLDGLPVSANWKKQMSKYEDIPPATIERASNILRSISVMNPKIDADKTIHRLIGNSLEAMDMVRPIRKAENIELDYKIEMLNADCNISEVSNGIIDKGQARVCLYGPPGTGKTAFGRYIAEMSDKQLIVKKASDIISPYLGISERNMARMFSEALDQDAVLLLDEADTYLQDRKKLQQSWEVSGVNEMLTQIESFEGVFICSTNLMDSLDTAALRRFDLKIKFGHLTTAQAWGLFVDTANRLEINLDGAMQHKLSSLNALTPGDYAAVLRQSRFRPIKDSWDLLGRLNAECAIKPEGNKRQIGFH